MASENRVISIQLASPAAKAVEVFTHVYQRQPSASERATLGRICEAYRAAWGREADAEWICLSVASMAAARDTAAEAVRDLVSASEDFANRTLTAATAAAGKITTAQAGALAGWRHRVWYAAIAGAAAVGWFVIGVEKLIGELDLPWIFANAIKLSPFVLAGIAFGVAAMMAFPEAWYRVSRRGR